MNPSFSQASSPNPDGLIAGEYPRLTEDVTILAGQNVVRGAVLGQITVGAVTAQAAAGNTGNGTIGTLSAGAGAKPGVYKVMCIEPGANLGTFAVEEPDGNIIGRAIVGTPFAGAVNFTIADGATDFVPGDAFDVTVAFGSGKYRLSATASTDGSQRPKRILVDDTDATAADKKAGAYRTGEFSKTALTYGAGHSAATVAAALEAENIYLRDTLD